MAVTFFPFNSIVVDGVPDRPANAENLAAYLAGFFSNGVLMQEDTALKVEAYSGMEVQIHAGMGNINGKTILNDAAEIIILDTANASLARIDRVVFRLDEVNRLMEFAVLTGTPAASPVAPALAQGADVYEMCLAEIRVPAGASEILASYITDTRADAELCGVAAIPAHIQELKYGGTSATTAAGARENIGLICDVGSVASENIAAGAYRDVSITFNKKFEAPPIVFFNLYSTSTDGNVGKCSAAYVPNSGSANGCKIRIFNGDTSTRSPALEWKAMNKDLFI